MRFRRRDRGPQPGELWNGRSEYVDAAEAALRDTVPGHYAVLPDGRRLRCVAVDDAPGDPNDGAWHLEIAAKGDPIAREGRIVPLQAHGHGATGTRAST